MKHVVYFSGLVPMWAFVFFFTIHTINRPHNWGWSVLVFIATCIFTFFWTDFIAGLDD